ncbi:PREDICTED: transmembrane protein 238 [Lepidothrix coronata]|uniref:Transmembrane protein 238 n=1 Tax=Lepidothrix coronata TaxID=321398 RepID=A0A6J0IZS4_9PASS|nr:PREDICTED: transmembrane protein 238 [Lepidothrix coronata]
MGPLRLLARCAVFALVALLCDFAGLIFLLLGIFAPISSWDFFVYVGALLLAFSLLFWTLWYTFNIEVPFGELGLS